MTPSKEIEDRGSNVKITALRAINVGGKGYVKIETNMDVVGWGEINNMDTKVACALAESLSEILIGENPTRIEHLWQRMFRSHRNIRGGGLMVHTISGIDMALWDIAGKCYGVPVYKLLGGPTRERVRVYGEVSDKTGVNAMKVGPSSSRKAFKYVEGKMFVDEVAERFKSLRDKHGPGVDIGVDFHGAVQPPTAMLLMKALEPYDPTPLVWTDHNEHPRRSMI